MNIEIMIKKKKTLLDKNCIIFMSNKSFTINPTLLPNRHATQSEPWFDTHNVI